MIVEMFSVKFKVKDGRSSTLPKQSVLSRSRRGSNVSINSLRSSIASSSKSPKKDKKVRIFTTAEQNKKNGKHFMVIGVLFIFICVVRLVLDLDFVCDVIIIIMGLE